MSTQVHAPQPTRAHAFEFADLIAAGRVPALAVLAAGATLGFFFWYGVIVPMHEPGISEAALLLCVPLAALLAAAVWHAYGKYFSRRTGIKLSHSLRYDALTWLPFLLLWLTFFVMPSFTHGARILAFSLAFFCLGKMLIAARFNQTVRKVLVDFLVSRAAIIVIAELAAVIIGQRAGTHVQESRHALLAVWGRWDAVHYLTIATQGYSGVEPAFFPLYPLLIRLFGSLVGNHLIAGILISNASFFFGLLFLYKLLEHEYDRTVARRAIFYVSIFPTAVYFSAVYTESLFFMLTVASFYYMRAQRWWLAGIIGFFAALTRAEGLLLALPFAIEWFGRYRAEPLRGVRDAAAGLLIPMGLGLYMAYLWVLRADPLYFSHAQTHWGRHPAMPWVSIVNAFAKMTHSAAGQVVANQALELGFTALMIAVLLIGWRRLRPSYTAYMALSVLVPLCTSSLMSMPRFALVLFPMFAILARWGERPWANNLIVAFSLPLLGLFTVLFADWYWVA
ncbi:MAG TPA: mannosyltransferase family protein [Candidatus Tyrphobacter sp.]